MNIKQVKRKHIVRMFEYCQNVLGYSKYQENFPEIQVNFRKSKKEDDVDLGWYDFEDNIIRINIPQHISFIELCSTMIHEYTHYLQNREKYYRIYRRLEKQNEDYYNDHPLEIMAVSNAELLKKDCKRYVVTYFSDKK